jgi:hypothetical protein
LSERGINLLVSAAHDFVRRFSHTAPVLDMTTATPPLDATVPFPTYSPPTDIVPIASTGGFLYQTASSALPPPAPQTGALTYAQQLARGLTTPTGSLVIRPKGLTTRSSAANAAASQLTSSLTSMLPILLIGADSLSL